jgi:putative hemolysin
MPSPAADLAVPSPKRRLMLTHLAYHGLLLGLGMLVWELLGGYAQTWSGSLGLGALCLLCLIGSQLVWRLLCTKWPSWFDARPADFLGGATPAPLDARGADLFLTLSEFSGTVIREIMVPRTEMVALAQSASRLEVQQLVLEAGHSRLPVFDDTIDNIVGVLHVKDLFVARLHAEATGESAVFSLAEMVRPTFYVPEVMKISELLRDFQRRKTHLAIVVDEYGGTAGVVTLEDIIEEIVGEIQDEYDVEEKQFRVLGDKIIADGRVSIWDIEEALGVEFPDDADYETLAGFLMSRTGSLPEPGMIINWGQYRFLIKEANAKRVRTVEIDKLAS